MDRHLTDASPLGTSNYSVRWTGLVVAPASGLYTFSAMSASGVKLWINDVLIINNWTAHTPTQNSANLTLTAGRSYP